MAEINECPFCNAADRVIKENGTAQAFLSNPHKVPGHMLVMPKRHIEKPWEMTAQELKEVFDLIFFIERRLIGKLGEGCDIRQNYRPFGGYSKFKVDHVHFHVIPRSPNDYLYQISEQYESDLFADLDEMERAAVTKLLR